jgi:repressor LexA
MELTQRQKQICQFIAQFAHDHGFAPTIREIQGGLDISSTSVVHYNLRALARAGKLTRKDGFSRTIVLKPNWAQGLANLPWHANSIQFGGTRHAE